MREKERERVPLHDLLHKKVGLSLFLSFFAKFVNFFFLIPSYELRVMRIAGLT